MDLGWIRETCSNALFEILKQTIKIKFLGSREVNERKTKLCSVKYPNCLLTGKLEAKETKKALHTLPWSCVHWPASLRVQEGRAWVVKTHLPWGVYWEALWSMVFSSSLLLSRKFTGSYTVLKMMLQSPLSFFLTEKKYFYILSTYPISNVSQHYTSCFCKQKRISKLLTELFHYDSNNKVMNIF